MQLRRVVVTALLATSAAVPNAFAQSAVLVVRPADTALVQRQAAMGRRALVTLDGQSVGTLLPRDAALSVTPGRHIVVVTLEGHIPYVDAIVVGAGERAVVEARLVPMSMAVQRLAVQPVIRPGGLVRINTTTGIVEGRLVAADTAALTLAGAAPIPLAAVDTLWQRESNWLPGGLIGGGVGGLLIGVFLEGMSHGEDCESQGSCGGGFAPGFVVGAAGGFALGAAIGAAIPSWKRRYVR